MMVSKTRQYQLEYLAEGRCECGRVKMVDRYRCPACLEKQRLYKMTRKRKLVCQ
jgi:hypothetical protein